MYCFSLLCLRAVKTNCSQLGLSMLRYLNSHTQEPAQTDQALFHPKWSLVIFLQSMERKIARLFPHSHGQVQGNFYLGKFISHWYGAGS